LPLLPPPPWRQVITLSGDHVVRLWDLRTHKCVQTICGAGAVRA
jgi:WD40 repeat protein